MENNLTSYPEPTDITTCESEPIHLIPRTQHHGFLLVLDNKQEVIQVSQNIHEFLDINHADALGKRLEDLCDKATSERFNSWLIKKKDHVPFIFKSGDHQYTAIPHQVDALTLIDIEPETFDWDPIAFQQEMLDVLHNLHKTGTAQELTQSIADLVKDMLDYDRVMVYRFDDQWNGEIVAEAREPELKSWLGLHYPAGDIPANARKLFLEQGVRILSDLSRSYSDILPSINPVTGALLPTGKSHLRGSSPIHVEYLNNMKVDATLNCAIVHNGKLWGLIACHHYSPKFIGYHKRKSCQLLAEMVSNQITLKNSDVHIKNINKAAAVRSKLVKQMSKNWDIVAGLTSFQTTGKSLIPAHGFAVFYDQEYATIGTCPDRKVMQRLSNEIRKKIGKEEQYFETDCLSAVFPWTSKYGKDLSGILYFKISNKNDEALIWFKKEKLSQINWGGDPSKTDLDNESENRLSPRKSFEKYSQTVKCTSEPWEDHEKASAQALVSDVKNIIVTRYGEIKMLNKRLESLNQELESFSYSVSHDLRGPLRGIDGFAQILKEDYDDVLDEYGKDSLNTIINSASKMNSLMDDILSYSSMSQTTLIDDHIKLPQLCERILKENRYHVKYPDSRIIIDDQMPDLYGDASMIYQLFANLISNALKYSSKKENPVVEIGSKNDGEKEIYFVKDNGIGFDQEYATKIFGVFSRLFKDEYEGTGVGLAIVQRVVIKHGGEIWAQGTPNEGSVFKFYLGHGGIK
ncbi:ATP-binding protein [Nonlabens ponticola]|uniref:histidine kinase n=1 Tax=Nonlabens ponticola TaxID=2496866 RepID=A0A3S9MVV3_9FLAO|nr:ATP-binding protein [Nonlabens ponticola]AZQ43259.1 GAF domain-containing protein [Nonlabens ponticola]